MTKGIDLSIVVALISGNTSDLDRCLRSLVTQTFEGSLEIIVPYDPPCAHVCSLQEDYPTVRFHAADHLNTALARQGAAREHHDALRTIGIRAAKGTIVSPPPGRYGAGSQQLRSATPGPACSAGGSSPV